MCAVSGLVAGRALVVAPGTGKDRVLAWTPLEGASVHVIANLGREGILEATPPVMDEDSVAYALTSCTDQPAIYRARLAEPGAPPPPPTNCPVRIAGGRATLSGTSLRIKLACPSGCEGAITEAYIGTSTQLRRGRATFIYGDGPPFVTASGKSLSITLLSPEPGNPYTRLIRRLRRDHRLRVGLRLRLSSPTDQLADGEHGTETPIVVPIRVEAGRSR